MPGRRRSQRLNREARKASNDSASTSTPKMRGGRPAGAAGAGKGRVGKGSAIDSDEEQFQLPETPAMSMIADASTLSTHRSTRASTRAATVATSAVLRSKNHPGAKASRKVKRATQAQRMQQQQQLLCSPDVSAVPAASEDTEQEESPLNVTDYLLSDSPAPPTRRSRPATAGRPAQTEQADDVHDEDGDLPAAKESEDAADADILCESPMPQPRQQQQRQTAKNKKRSKRQAQKKQESVAAPEVVETPKAEASEGNHKPSSDKRSTNTAEDNEQKEEKQAEGLRTTRRMTRRRAAKKQPKLIDEGAEASSGNNAENDDGEAEERAHGEDEEAQEPARKTVGRKQSSKVRAKERPQQEQRKPATSARGKKSDKTKQGTGESEERDSSAKANVTSTKETAVTTTRGDIFDFGEVLSSMPRSQQAKLWTALHATLYPLYDRYVDGDLMAQKKTENLEQGALETLSVFDAVALLLTGAVAQDPPHVTEDALQCAQILHESLFSLPTDSDNLRDHVVKLCEAWWFSELNGRELLVPLTVSQLLVRALVVDAKPAAVKRVFAMREAFTLIDLNSDSSASLRGLLLQAFVNPNFVTLLEGQRFLSFVFALSPKFIGDVWQTLKDTLPYCGSRLLDGYGQVLYRAWRGSSGATHEAIEHTCIQDLMVCAAQARRRGSLQRKSVFQVCFALLEVFHGNKKERGVDDMLIRLYDPIIWRSMQVANPVVRANAASLLFAAFPLQDPQSLRQEREAVLQKQFEACSRCLEDDSPLVRRVAVEGVCRILSTFWEVIPAHAISCFLDNLIKNLARDKASPDVRASVFKGLAFILDNPLAQSTMKPLLKHVAPSLHDTSRKVRGAFLNMLLAVRGIKSIRFFDVVSVDHLLARLELEDAASATKIVRLLCTSFFPLTNASDEERVRRCVEIQRHHPGACRHFYFRLLDADVAPTDIARFVVILANYILHSDADDDEENDDVLLDAFEDENEQSVTDVDKKRLVEVVAILLKSLEQSRTRYKAILRKLGKALAPFVEHLQEAYEGDAVMCDLALLISATAPAPPKRSDVRARVQELCELPTDFTPSQAEHYIDWLCACDQLPAVLYLCEHWLTAALSLKHKPKFTSTKPQAGRKGAKATVLSARDLSGCEKDNTKAPLASFAVRHVLEMYGAHFDRVEAAFASLRRMFTTAIQQAAEGASSMPAAVLGDVFRLALEVELLAAPKPAQQQHSSGDSDEGQGDARNRKGTELLWEMLSQQLSFVKEALVPLCAGASAAAKKKRHKSGRSVEECRILTEAVLQGAVVCVRVQSPPGSTAQLLVDMLSAVLSTPALGQSLSGICGQLVAHVAVAGVCEREEPAHLARVEALFDALFALGPGHETLVADTFLFVFKSLRRKFEGVVEAMARRACTKMLQHKTQDNGVSTTPPAAAKQTLDIVVKSAPLVRMFASKLPPADADESTSYVSLQLLHAVVDGTTSLPAREQRATATMLHQHIQRAFAGDSKENEHGETAAAMAEGVDSLLQRLAQLQTVE